MTPSTFNDKPVARHIMITYKIGGVY